MQVQLEMQDDPQWMDQMQGNMVWLGWSWDQYFAWMRQPWTYATAHCLNACSRQTGTRVEVYQCEGTKLKQVTVIQGPATDHTVRLLRHALHYSLLLPRVSENDGTELKMPTRRMNGKQPVKSAAVKTNWTERSYATCRKLALKPAKRVPQSKEQRDQGIPCTTRGNARQ